MYSRKVGYSKRAQFNRFRMLLEGGCYHFDNLNHVINNMKHKPRFGRKKPRSVRK